MTDLNLPSIFVPLVGLVFPAIAMASLFLYVEHKVKSSHACRKIRLSSIFSVSNIIMVGYVALSTHK